MITILSGGKPSPNSIKSLCEDYEKRLRKPFDLKWEFLSEEKLDQKLAKWPFSHQDFVIILDERGENITSPKLAEKLNTSLTTGKNLIIVIGGAFGIRESARQKADFLWSLSNLVFPHLLVRLILTEQIYRAYSIINHSKYHHE